MSKIFFIEDDFSLRRDIQELLENQGETVITASGYQEALHMIINHEEADLYLIDVMLFDGSGFTLCEKIRQRNNKPIIFLTARSDEDSIVRGLNLGADDYITKPFRIRELLSRIQANLRREKRMYTNLLYSGDLMLDKKAELIYKSGKVLNLSKIEYKLICFFMEHPGIVLKRECILENIWDNNGKYVEDNTLSVAMSRLRHKLGDYQGNSYWEVVWGIGYRYLLPVHNQKPTEI